MLNPIDTPQGEMTPDHRLRSRIRLLLATSLVLLLAAATALPIDVPLGRWCLDTFSASKGARGQAGMPWWLEFAALVLRFAELFGHGLGVALIVCLIFTLDPNRRWAIPRLLTVSIASGLAVDVLKGLVGRTRPYAFDFDGSVWHTFVGWFLLGKSSAAIQSIPSGHTGLAVGLAIALIWIYPRGHYLFPLLAVLVACQRVQAGAHWLSDVLTAGAVGCLVALVVLYVGPIPRMFCRWEAVWQVRDRERERRRME